MDVFFGGCFVLVATGNRIFRCHSSRRRRSWCMSAVFLLYNLRARPGDCPPGRHLLRHTRLHDVHDVSINVTISDAG